jgi:hypothetical protein
MKNEMKDKWNPKANGGWGSYESQPKRWPDSHETTDGETVIPNFLKLCGITPKQLLSLGMIGIAELVNYGEAFISPIEWDSEDHRQAEIRRRVRSHLGLRD